MDDLWRCTVVPASHRNGFGPEWRPGSKMKLHHSDSSPDRPSAIKNPAAIFLSANQTPAHIIAVDVIPAVASPAHLIGRTSAAICLGCWCLYSPRWTVLSERI